MASVPAAVWHCLWIQYSPRITAHSHSIIKLIMSSYSVCLKSNAPISFLLELPRSQAVCGTCLCFTFFPSSVLNPVVSFRSLLTYRMCCGDSIPMRCFGSTRAPCLFHPFVTNLTKAFSQAFRIFSWLSIACRKCRAAHLMLRIPYQEPCSRHALSFLLP